MLNKVLFIAMLGLITISGICFAENRDWYYEIVGSNLRIHYYNNSNYNAYHEISITNANAKTIEYIMALLMNLEQDGWVTDVKEGIYPVWTFNNTFNLKKLCFYKNSVGDCIDIEFIPTGSTATQQETIILKSNASKDEIKKTDYFIARILKLGSKVVVNGSAYWYIKNVTVTDNKLVNYGILLSF